MNETKLRIQFAKRMENSKPDFSSLLVAYSRYVLLVGLFGHFRPCNRIRCGLVFLSLV